MNAAGAAWGGWMLDSTSLGISGMIWLMAGLVLVPGVLWVLWNAGRRKSQPEESPTVASAPRMTDI